LFFSLKFVAEFVSKVFSYSRIYFGNIIILICFLFVASFAFIFIGRPNCLL